MSAVKYRFFVSLSGEMYIVTCESLCARFINRTCVLVEFVDVVTVERVNIILTTGLEHVNIILTTGLQSTLLCCL